ncbi:MAG TPA: hypothetical protein DCZ04_14660 [Syntrophorhabdus aromaticivorans]|nr:hypothetical protein [Syntrophorhabdus aromaticivorans]
MIGNYTCMGLLVTQPGRLSKVRFVPVANLQALKLREMRARKLSSAEKGVTRSHSASGNCITSAVIVKEDFRDADGCIDVDLRPNRKVQVNMLMIRSSRRR